MLKTIRDNKIKILFLKSSLPLGMLFQHRYSLLCLEVKSTIPVFVGFDLLWSLNLKIPTEIVKIPIASLLHRQLPRICAITSIPKYLLCVGMSTESKVCRKQWIVWINRCPQCEVTILRARLKSTQTPTLSHHDQWINLMKGIVELHRRRTPCSNSN